MTKDDIEPQKRPRRITAQMVANVAGVSRSAVSRAFTDGAYLDADKREKIKQVAMQLGYQPNALAASLQGRRSHLIAVFVGDMRSIFDAEFVARLVGELTQLHKWPILIDGGGKNETTAIEEIMRFPLDALILRGGSMPEELVHQCVKFNIPIISSGRLVKREGVDCVVCDHSHGTGEMTRLLLEKGRRYIGYIGGPENFFSSAGRKQGVLAALQETGLSLQAETSCDYTYEGGYEAAGRLLSGHNKLDALICANDESALGALAKAQGLQKSVPHDIAIVGFDDISMAKWPNINLTTVRNPLDETVFEVIKLLRRRLDKSDAKSKNVFLKPKLVLRGTH